MGFCHNDTQYGNLLLHTASDATLEAQTDAQDLLDVRGSLEELPSGRLERKNRTVEVELGSSPPSYSSLLYHMVSVLHCLADFVQSSPA